MNRSTSIIDRVFVEADVNDLKEDIEKQFGKFNVNVGVKASKIMGNRIVFLLKTKGNTREAHIRANAPEVQRKLKLPLFQVVRYNFELCLIVSQEQIVYAHLLGILNTSSL